MQTAGAASGEETLTLYLLTRPDLQTLAAGWQFAKKGFPGG
jgi:hypothetical protein